MGLGISAFRARRANAGLMVKPEALDFGSVWESPAFAWSVAVHNPNDEPIVIESWHVSCSCTKAEPPRLTIPSGESRDVNLTLNLSSAFPADSVADSVPFSVQLVPVVAGAPRDNGWEISGIIERAIIFQPQRLQATIVGQRPLEVQVMAQVPIDETRIEFPRRLFSAASLVEDRRSPGVFRLELVPQSGLPGGIYPTEVVLHPVPSEETISSARLPIMLTVPGPLLVMPKEILFGAISRGETPLETLFIESRDSDDPIRIVETRHNGSVISRCETTDQFLVRHRIQVIPNYKIMGTHSGALEVIAENAAGRRMTVTIPLRAYVLATRPADGVDISSRPPVEAPTEK